MVVMRAAVGQGVGSGSQRPDEATIRANAAAIRGLMRAAARQGVRLAVFTEGALSSCADKRIMSSDPDRLAEADWSRVAWAALDDELSQLRKLAAELGIWVVVGCIWPTGESSRPYNSLIVIDDAGVITSRYDKRHLSPTESTYMYRAGQDPLVITIDGFKIGLLICIEAMLPDLVIEYDRLEVDAIVISSYADEASEESQEDQRALAYANMINSWVLLAVPGAAPGQVTCGIAAPGFRWLSRGVPTGEPQLVIADLDRDEPLITLGRERARPWRVRQRELRSTKPGKDPFGR